MDYSHPRFYLIIGLFAIILSLITGLTLSRGFYFALLGLMIFPFIYNYYTEQYDRDERNLVLEFALSMLGFIFLPLGYFANIYDSILPNTIDFVFFIIGFCAIELSTSILYLVEPEDNRQAFIVIIVSSLILFAIIVLIKIYTIGGYLGGFT